jgi:hypothetical protein
VIPYLGERVSRKCALLFLIDIFCRVDHE